jgi:hypothetical protein
MNVIVTVSREKEGTYMKMFTIDTDNNITVHLSRKAARETGAGVFTTAQQLAELIGPDNKRFVQIWNSLAGVKPVTKFANRKAATERIWKAIQRLGDPAVKAAAEPQIEASDEDAIPPEFRVAEPATADAHQGGMEVAQSLEDAALQAEIEPIAITSQDPAEAAEPVPSVAAPQAQDAPANVAPTKTAAGAKKPRKAKNAPKPDVGAGLREGSKTAQVVAMLKTAAGATLAEIMARMGWQKHTVRGFMAGAMKKAGYTVESFKSDKGERTYRINP